MGITHKSAGSIKKGDTIVMDGAACTVTSLQSSKAGKHGHSKVRVEGVGMVDGKKRQAVMPSSHDVEVPIVDKRNAQILSVSGNSANVMDMESYETFDIKIPSELQGKVAEGQTVLYWIILGEKILKQVRNG
ncbi:translation initiation factor IF-5A [Nanoarchaeota archaeon]